MELTTQQQTTAFLWAFVLGAVIEVIYFVIASVRAAVPPDNKTHIFVVDLVFMLSVSCLNILYAISQTEGKVRLYVIFAETLSFAVLYFTIGRFLKKKFAIMVLAVVKIYHRQTKKVVNKYIQMSSCFKQKYSILHRKEKK